LKEAGEGGRRGRQKREAEGWLKEAGEGGRRGRQKREAEEGSGRRQGEPEGGRGGGRGAREVERVRLIFF
jgi:hypothetical protein